MSAAGLRQQQEGRGTIQLLQHLAESDFEDVNRGLLHPDGYLCENMSLINTWITSQIMFTIYPS